MGQPRWLTQGGISAEDHKAILEVLQERIFKSLKPSHIHDKYYELLAELSKRIKEATKKAD